MKEKIEQFNFRGQYVTYNWNWLDNDIFELEFGDGDFTDSENNDYFLHFEYHVNDNQWIIEVWWEYDNININELYKCDADEYITEKEIEEVKKFAEQFMD